MFLFFGYPIGGLGSYSRKVGYAKKGVWYEPTGTVCFGTLMSLPPEGSEVWTPFQSCIGQYRAYGELSGVLESQLKVSRMAPRTIVSGRSLGLDCPAASPRL